jgi:hypothetical protein
MEKNEEESLGRIPLLFFILIMRQAFAQIS